MRKLLPLIFVAACGGSTPAPTATPKGDAYATFVEDYFGARQAWSPSRATAEGFHQYDQKLEDRSRGRIDARVAELHGFKTRLETIDRGKLGFEDQLDAQMLASDIDGELLRLETLKLFERNPMSYAGGGGSGIDGLMKRNFAPGPERARSVIARLRQVPALYAAGKANLRDPAKEFTDVAIIMSKGAMIFFETSVPTWGREATGGDAALMAELEKAAGEALAAARDFNGWLEKDLKPRSTGSYAVGAETYAALLRADEMVTMPIPELLAIGEAQLAKDHEAFIATARKIDATKTPAEVMSAMSADHPTADDLIPAVARSLEEVRSYVVEKGIMTVPSEVRARVAETPLYDRGSSFASMDTPGPFEEKATEAFYYVTPVEKEWDAKRKDEHLRLYNRPVIALIDIHEAYPGHYVQFLYAPRFATKTRKLTGAATNSEGWAHYAEQMMIDEGFGGGDPRYRLAQLSEALVRDCRFVTGIKLHTAGWTVEQGAKLCEEKGFMEPANAFEEARRGTFDPTYLYYTLGKLEILKLRDEYRQKTGASLKQFHDTFIAQGPLPIPLVRKALLERR